MYSPHHYRSRADLALALSKRPENFRLRRDYIQLSVAWQALALVAELQGNYLGSRNDDPAPPRTIFGDAGPGHDSSQVEDASAALDSGSLAPVRAAAAPVD